MLKNHPLLGEAHRFPINPALVVVGWRYRRDLGAWVDDTAPDSLMVAHMAAKPGEEPSPKPPRPVPVSKKADRETGEDMKGA